MFNVMSFNLLCRMPDDERKNRVLTMIKQQEPDILGVQEALPHWMDILTETFNKDYDCFGEGREGGNNGEYNTIFYKKGIFNIIDKGIKWLTDTPDVISVLEGSSCYRILTYIIFEVKETGKRFLFINTHLEHTSERVRLLQVEVLINFAKSFDMPTIVTGDFNCERPGDVYKRITDAGYNDVKYILNQQTDEITFHGYSKYREEQMLIDYIFIKGQGIDAIEYSVLNQKINGEYASDHHPIKAKINFK